MQYSFSSVLVGAVAGAVSAFIVTTFAGGADSGRPASGGNLYAAGHPGDAGVGSDLVMDLQRENQDLELRIARLEARPMPSAQRAAVEAEPGMDRAQPGRAAEQVAAPGRLMSPTGSLSQAYYDDFRTAWDMYDQERTEIRAEERRVRQEERREQRVQDLVQKLGLDEFQTGQVRGILGNQESQRSEAFSMMRDDTIDPPSRDEMREKMRVIDEDSNAAMQAVLTPLQYEDYQSSNRRGSGNRGGGRGGRGG